MNNIVYRIADKRHLSGYYIVHIYREIFSKMNVDWTYYKTEHIKRYGTKYKINKDAIVRNNPLLYQKFMAVAQQLLIE